MTKRKKPDTDTEVLSVRIGKTIKAALRQQAKDADKPFPYFMRRVLEDVARGNR